MFSTYHIIWVSLLESSMVWTSNLLVWGSNLLNSKRILGISPEILSDRHITIFSSLIVIKVLPLYYRGTPLTWFAGQQVKKSWQRASIYERYIFKNHSYSVGCVSISYVLVLKFYQNLMKNLIWVSLSVFHEKNLNIMIYLIFRHNIEWVLLNRKTCGLDWDKMEGWIL